MTQHFLRNSLAGHGMRNKRRQRRRKEVILLKECHSFGNVDNKDQYLLNIKTRDVLFYFEVESTVSLHVGLTFHRMSTPALIRK